MRRMVLAFTGLVLALAASAPAGSRAPAPVQPTPVTATTFVASGRGWGHGVGMSQYGALGFANEGRRYGEILAHFYPGTSLGAAPVARVRVDVPRTGPSAGFPACSAVGSPGKTTSEKGRQLAAREPRSALV